MRELAELLNAMREAGVISNYALFGATAQIRYTEPLATLDADVLVTLSDPARLDILRRLYEFCEVQFIPVFNTLTAEAVEQAETADFEGVPFRVVGAAHPAVIALSVGRGKDYARILALLESDAVTKEEIAALASRHGLEDAWMRFKRRFVDE